MPRVRKVPQRTCVGCQTVRPKKELVRVVRTPEGEVLVDPTGKKSGRGAYLCPNVECLKAAVKGKRLQKALEQPISEEVLQALGLRLGAMTVDLPAAGRRQKE
ncbi:MAG: YlxR family protein [Firmicutes bacterium]|nr:YlxR family protein [Bacillota bacterium]